MEQVEVDQRQRQIESKVRRARRLGRDFRPESDAESLAYQVESLAYQAVHYEEFGDLDRARECWQNVKQKTEAASQQKTWTMLANRKLQEIIPKLDPDLDMRKAARKELLKKKLDEATDLHVHKKTREARLICEEIRSLYPAGTDLELAEILETTGKLLEDLNKNPK